MKNKIVNFRGYKCKVVKAQYSNNKTALQLIAAEDNEEQEVAKGDPIAIATINIPEVNLEPNEVIIKNYSENIGMLEALIEAKVVKPTSKTITTGFVICPVCELV